MKEFRDKKLLIICNTFRGRRIKFYELQRRLFNHIKILSLRDSAGIDNLEIFNSMDGLRDKVIDYDPDVVHCNIDDSLPAKVVQDLGYKTVLDIHDCSILRGVTSDSHIKEVYEKAEYAIFINEVFEADICAKYDIKNHIAIPSLVPKRWMVKKNRKAILDSIVHIGSLAKSVMYRDIDYILARFLEEGEEGLTVHLYAIVGKSNIKNVIYHDLILNGKKFYREISQYRVGLVACNSNAPESELEYAHRYGLANRAFDYMAARIPTLGINMGGLANSYIKNWGVVINDEADFVEAWVEAVMKQIDFDYWQDEYNLDNYFEMLKGIYGSVIDG